MAQTRCYSVVGGAHNPDSTPNYAARATKINLTITESRDGMASAGQMAGHVSSGWHGMIWRVQDVLESEAECEAEVLGDLACFSGHR